MWVGGALVNWVVGCLVDWVVGCLVGSAYDKVVEVTLLVSVVCPRNLQDVKNKRALTILSNLFSSSPPCPASHRVLRHHSRPAVQGRSRHAAH